MSKFSPIFSALLLLSLPFEANLFGSVQAQQDDRTLRVLIEGDPSTAQIAIHKLNVAGFDRGLGIVLVMSPAEPHDIRLILTASSGQVWDTSPNIPADVPKQPVAFGYCSAVGLTPDGNVLFTLSASGDTPRAAMFTVASEVANRVYGNYAALKGNPRRPHREVSAAPKADAGGQPVAPTGGPTEPPDEIGVYYLESGKWIRIQPVEPVQTNSNSSASALLGWGLGGALAGVNVVQVYHGPNALTRISGGSPTFYVRGIAPTGDVIFVRFDKKRDSRELRLAHVTTWSSQSGPRLQDVTDAIVTGVGRDLFTITPRFELKSGEYLLRLVSPDLTPGGYDFGIAEKTK